MTNSQILFLLVLIGISKTFSKDEKSKFKYPRVQVEHLFSSEGVLVDNLANHFPMINLIKLKQQKQHSILEMSPSGNYTIQMYIEIADGVDRFSEVYNEHDENRFVLDSHITSDTFHLIKPLKSITENFCKHPLPKGYNIFMDIYNNRETLAYPTSASGPNSLNHYRSINDECTWEADGKILKSDETFELLDESLNSLYCSENSPLLTELFGETVEETETFVSHPKCESARARCTDCQIFKCKTNKCCQLKSNCLLQDSCLTYYNTSCYRSYEEALYNNKSRCIKGKTYKFTLIPEFDFNTDKFQCYLKKENLRPKVSVTLDFINRKWKFKLQKRSVKFGGRFPDSNVLQFNNLQLVFHPSLIDSMDEVIFGKKGFEHFIYPLKPVLKFDQSKPKIHKLFSKSYIKVQMYRPFLHNTETWSNEKCQVNISGIYKEQEIFEPSSKMPIELVKKQKMAVTKTKSVFSYQFLPKGLETQKILFQISVGFIPDDNSEYVKYIVKEKSSLLSLYFCHGQQLHKPANIKVRVENIDEQNWRLVITGKIIESISYFSLSISPSFSSGETIYKADIVVSKSSKTLNTSEYFNISFKISNLEPNINESINLLLIDFDQCQRKFFQKSIFLKFSERLDPMKDSTEIERSVDISNFILVVFLATICICFFYFVLLAFQAARKSAIIKNAKNCCSVNKQSKKMNYKLFMKIIFYMTLKLFYTVSFTLSLVLSVCLSLNVFAIHSINQSNFVARQNVNLNKFPSTEKSDLFCNEIPKLISKHFLVKIRSQLANQEIVRSLSAQSIQSVSLHILNNISIPRFHNSILEIINKYQRSLQQQNQLILNSNSRILKSLNQSKWLSPLQHWNATKMNNFFSNTDIFQNDQGGHLRISNLLGIYEFSSFLQSCKYLTKSRLMELIDICKRNFLMQDETKCNIVRLETTQERMKISLKPNEKEFKLRIAVKSGRFRRYFQTRIKQTTPYGNLSITHNKWQFHNKSLSFLTIDIFKIRLFFMLIDTALILYRCYWTFLDIRQMWNPKKQFIHLNQIILKANHSSSNVRTKSSLLHWTKHHHLECLVSAHLAIAAIIILLSIICMNLLVLLTSRDHSNWLSKKAGNSLRIRSIKDIKEELSKFNNEHINPVHRHWQTHKLSRIKQFMDHRKEAINRIMYLELFLNHQYFYELCGLQNLSIVPKLSLDFCHSLVPNHAIIPDVLCDRSLKYVPSLSFDLSSYVSSKSVIYIYQPLYLVLNILALFLFATSVVGILKVIRKSMEHKIFSSGKPVHIFLRSQRQMVMDNWKNPKALIKMKNLTTIPNVYSRNLEPPNQYQCKGDPFNETVNSSV